MHDKFTPSTPLPSAGGPGGDTLSPLGSPIVLQRRGSVYGANVPMITELINDSNVQFLDQVGGGAEKKISAWNWFGVVWFDSAIKTDTEAL